MRPHEVAPSTATYGGEALFSPRCITDVDLLQAQMRIASGETRAEQGEEWRCQPTRRAGLSTLHLPTWFGKEPCGELLVPGKQNFLPLPLHLASSFGAKGSVDQEV